MLVVPWFLPSAKWRQKTGLSCPGESALPATKSMSATSGTLESKLRAIRFHMIDVCDLVSLERSETKALAHARQLWEARTATGLAEASGATEKFEGERELILSDPRG